MVAEQPVVAEPERAEERVMVKATPERCFAVATDFESYPEWSSDIQKIDVLSRDDQGRGTSVRFWAEAMGRSTQYTLDYDYAEAPAALHWHLSEGDIERSLVGEYAFEAIGDQTELVYRLTVVLRVPMPGFVRRRVEGRILGAALQQLKTRAES